MFFVYLLFIVFYCIVLLVSHRIRLKFILLGRTVVYCIFLIYYIRYDCIVLTQVVNKKLPKLY